MNYPKISCICPTYGRVSLLEEAVQCFLDQKYEGEKELIICNDCEHQTLIFNHPEVKIFNIKKRFTSLGKKKNWMIERATGVYLLAWDDDDIYFPNRIKRIVDFALENKEHPFIYDGFYYIIYGGVLSLHTGAAAGMTLIKKSFFETLGGYDLINAGEDISITSKAEKQLNHPILTCEDTPEYIYRWSQHPRFHLSAYGEGTEGYNFIKEKTEYLINEKKEPRGNIILKPQYTKDWAKYLKDNLKHE